MTVTISKEFAWEMGHRLPYHTEGCQNIHGHSYRARVSVAGEPDAQGMVIDYTDLSRVLRPLLEQMDHAYMVDPSDELMKQTLDSSGLKRLDVPFFTTAENICAWLLEEIHAVLRAKPNVQRIEVTVMETAKTTATCAWSRDA